MASTQRVTTFVYGTVQGSPPYIGANPFAEQSTWSQQLSMSLPTTGARYHPTTQGIRFGNNYVYSIIELPPSGLQQFSTKYASSDTVATLVTNGT